tara:strand:- start:498 stop:1418 length:921 start_codon:yes stop_codon:yes gene_type:complete
MADKFKIAICVSGQTRHINNNPVYTQDFLEVLDLFSEYDYDLFGHTWSDQEDPNDAVLNKFAEYRSDDQRIIWDTINDPTAYQQPESRPVWPQFFTTGQNWFEKTDYQDIINGTSDKSYIDFAKERINGSIGQVWSAMESFLLTKKHWVSNNYRFVVKIRWDCQINNYVYANERIEDKKKEFKETLWLWTNHEGKFDWNYGNKIAGATCLTATDCFIEDGPFYANDHLYVIRGDAFEDRILNFTAIHTFENMIKRVAGGKGFVPSAHTLWAQWLLSRDLACSPLLYDLIQPNGPAPDDKPNKNWET